MLLKLFFFCSFLSLVVAFKVKELRGLDLNQLPGLRLAVQRPLLEELLEPLPWTVIRNELQQLPAARRNNLLRNLKGLSYSTRMDSIGK